MVTPERHASKVARQRQPCRDPPKRRNLDGFSESDRDQSTAARVPGRTPGRLFSPGRYGAISRRGHDPIGQAQDAARDARGVAVVGTEVLAVGLHAADAAPHRAGHDLAAREFRDEFRQGGAREPRYQEPVVGLALRRSEHRHGHTR